MADSIQLRRDTAASWTTANPILAQGEVGISIDLTPPRMKVGDGLTAWNDLAYTANTPADVQAMVDAVQANLNTHVSDPDNPHNVTAGQVGAYTVTETDILLANTVGIDDPRLTDARMPTGHQATHITGGMDALSAADIGAETPAGAQAKVGAHAGAVTAHSWGQISGKPSTVATSGLTDAETVTGAEAKANAAKAQSISYTDDAIVTLMNSAPEQLDTLYELANALGNDPNFSVTMLGLIGAKASQADFAAHVNSVAAHAWSAISGKPTTLAGYGIANAYTKTEIDATIGGIYTKSEVYSKAEAYSKAETYDRSVIDNLSVPSVSAELAMLSAMTHLPADVIKGKLSTRVFGRTLVNLLGREGNFEIDANGDGRADGWTAGNLYGATATIVTDTDGSKAQRITTTVNDTSLARRVERNDVYVGAGKYYVALIEASTDGLPTTVGSLVLANNTAGSTIIPLSNINPAVSRVAHKITVATSGTIFYRLYNQTPIGTVGWIQFKKARFYEVDLATYNKLDVDPEYTGLKLYEKFPYVDSVGSSTATRIRTTGKNLIPTSEDGWEQGSYGTGGGAPVVDATVIRTKNFCQVVTGQTYVKSQAVEFITSLRVYDSAGNFLRNAGQGSIFTPTGQEKLVKITAAFINSSNITPSAVSAIKHQLEAGSVATTFEPYEETTRYLPTLSSIGTYKDELSNGKYIKRVSGAILLTGDLDWKVSNNNSGSKRVQCVFPDALTAASSTNIIVAMNNGTLLTAGTTAGGVANACQIAGGGTLLMNIANSDTGFPDGMAPTVSEWKAYFWGWKICGSAGGQWDIGSTKYWKKITDGTGITSTIPIASYVGFTPYTLVYVLATPVITDLPETVLNAQPNGAIIVEAGAGSVAPEIYYQYPLNVAASVAGLNNQAKDNSNRIGILDAKVDTKINTVDAVRYNGNAGSARIQTSLGYVDIGSQDVAYSHYNTDRPSHYFNKPVIVNGNINPTSVSTSGVIDSTTGFFARSSSPLRSKLTGYKSWLLHHPAGQNFVFAPSLSINGEDWDWSHIVTLTDTGGITTAGPIAATISDATIYSPTSTSTGSPVNVINNVNNDSQTSGSFVGSRYGVKNGSNLIQYAYIGAVSVSGALRYSPDIVIGNRTGSTSYAERLRILGNNGYFGNLVAPKANLHFTGGAILGLMPVASFSAGNLSANEFSAYINEAATLYCIPFKTSAGVLKTINIDYTSGAVTVT